MACAVAAALPPGGSRRPRPTWAVEPSSSARRAASRAGGARRASGRTSRGLALEVGSVRQDVGQDCQVGVESGALVGHDRAGGLRCTANQSSMPAKDDTSKRRWRSDRRSSGVARRSAAKSPWGSRTTLLNCLIPMPSTSLTTSAISSCRVLRAHHSAPRRSHSTALACTFVSPRPRALGRGTPATARSAGGAHPR